jgi:hypothetical protein
LHRGYRAFRDARQNELREIRLGCDVSPNDAPPS